ncbi:zinc finger protein 257, partial [Pyrenophora tritici-repentis]
PSITSEKRKVNNNKGSADQHMDDKGHREPQFKCETCDKRFNTQHAADQHMDDKGHRES